ncbi:putative ABC transporter, ATP-binding protein [Desulfonema limicola]|uniref:ABC transporter, ATP-binding protein n=1 Tax=Desulfonema limicola TaxID=45656 RepID=A0A975GGC1_9BACT|nr:ATP-binding cassette domain-containing protein [Desulfonema limicola]QTA80114.1 putative ABC transporter, ATP-binding protein [Desulfonema limicola]
MILESCNISYKYPGTDNFVFQDLSLRLAKPGFNALFGPSGVGKTSFAKIISGNIKDFSGELKFENIKNIAYTYNLERLPGWSAIAAHLDKITPDEKQDIKQELVSIFGLEECMDHRFSQLSLGQKNRINLIRYLVQDFDLLILDESLANVDELTRENIILRIKDMFPHTCFLYISHNVVEVSKLCRQIFVLRGINKTPQLKIVQGLDLKTGEKLERSKLDITMLEIMNAA